MTLSISNIGWTAIDDDKMYRIMKEYGFSGLEIAPTRIFPEAPYDKLKKAKAWARVIRKLYGFVVPSMQSIWFGRREKLFGTEKERTVLIDYTKKAIDFAAIIDCKNLVFGCPRNRVISEDSDPEIGIGFFKEIGDYAASKGTVIGMEANPPIYNTNYITDTMAALKLIEEVNSAGFLLNLDVGTMIQNGESVDELKGKVELINHVHISEPGLKPIEKRPLHKLLREVLIDEGYQGFISIEMRQVEDISVIDQTMDYIRRIFF
ncbi:MAG: sugar phosphate isomerase/epimerase [Lachnospiraceae bacterium]|nr:sugar phosphate isomerase/epimerase [Lachnospiraceae bacterium]